jgi:hypothetical protein
MSDVYRAFKEAIVYEKGDRVVCPGCGMVVATVARSLVRGEPLIEGQFEWQNGYRCEVGERPIHCGEPWFMWGRLNVVKQAEPSIAEFNGA